MSGHTPGPWEVGGYGGVVIPVNRNGSIICSMHGRESVYQGDNCKANAHLIAASPDLLAFAKAYAETWVAAGGMPLDDENLKDMCLSAIAKAEGRQ